MKILLLFSTILINGWISGASLAINEYGLALFCLASAWVVLCVLLWMVHEYIRAEMRRYAVTAYKRQPAAIEIMEHEAVHE